MNTCLQRTKLACVTNISAPNTGRTPSNLEDCVKALPTVSCTDFLEGNPQGACMITGKLPNGTACAFGDQCQTGFCAVPYNTACGACADLPKVGDPCDSYGCRNLDCVTDPMTQAQTCVAWGTSGSMCNRQNPCGPDLVCVGASSTAMGTCQAGANMLGAACDARDQIMPACDLTIGLSCSSTTAMCVDETFAMGGQPCGQLTDGSLGTCYGDGLCVRAMGSRTGACVAPAADGAACDTVAGPPCLTPARCIVTSAGGTAGTCMINDATKCM